MDESNQNQTEQPEATTPEGNEGTSISKFKSAEDRDKAYLELEQKHSQQAQALAEMNRKFEDFQASQQLRSEQSQQADNRSFTDQYKSPDELKKFWSRFAENPAEILGAVEERAMARAEQRMLVRDAARDAINEFKVKNPDLAPYDEIVTVYVNQQSANLTPRERLERAAPLARKMITQIAQKSSGAGSDRITNPDTYVESPSGNRQAASQHVAPAKEEDALTEYLREQSEFMAKKQMPPQKRAS